MQQKKCFEELMSIVKHNRANIREVCEEVWTLVNKKQGSEQEFYFTAFLRDVDLYDVDLDDDVQVNFEEADSNFSKVKDLEKRIVGSLVNGNPSEESFYSQLWNKINDDLLFPDYSSQVSFLTCLWSDARIPYFQLDKGCLMENEEYQAILEELSPYIKKANFIMSTNLQQRTQRASLIMKIAEEIGDDRKKTVFWAFILSHASVQIKPDQILEIIKKAISDGKLSVEIDEK